MGITFAWRSDTSSGQAFRNLADGRMHKSRLGVDVLYQSTTASGIGDNSYLLVSKKHEMSFLGNENFNLNSAYSVLCRWAPDYNGAAPVNHHILGFGGVRSLRSPGFMLIHRTTGPIEAWVYDTNAIARYSANVVANFSATSGKFVDLFLTFRGDTSSTLSFYMDNILQTSPAVSFLNTYSTVTSNAVITLGHNILYGNGQGYHNEVVVWDSHISPNSLTTISPLGVTATGDSLDGSARTNWVDCAKLNGIENSDPGIANVLSGTAYTIEGASLTGTFASPSSSDPGIANVLSGTGYTIDDISLTGSLHVASYSDPGIANVRLATDYVFNDSTITGTLQVPTPVSGTSTTINIPNIKEQIRFALASNNTTTSSVLDLSASMTQRVVAVKTINPENIMPQATRFPAVCVYTDSKAISPVTIAKDQVNGKRLAKLKINLAGMVWNQNMAGNEDNDPADDDIERLMENTEKVLRHYHDLAGVVKWQFPTDVTYHNAAFDEETHFRVAFLDMELTIFY